MRNRLVYGIAGIVIIVITVVYWPALHGKFVWTDVLDFVDMTWLTHGDSWKHYIFKGFNNWTNYFRPLVVAFYTLQVRLFDGAPGPMHAVSLFVHLINTLLVGLLSWHCSQAMDYDSKRRACLLAVSMLLYGLHPVLIESVAWIGCQFDLVVTMFMLGGMLAYVRILSPFIRAIVVGSLFFLAACSKESAVSFPLMLAVFDLALLPQNRNEGIHHAIHAFVKRNWQPYAAMLLAGFAYLFLRHHALGQLVNPIAVRSFSVFAQLQEACFIYLHYWKMLLWPMSGMSPLHEIDTQQFHVISTSALFVDAIAIGSIAVGLYTALRRSSPIGCIVIMMTVALLPVLHVAPVAFAPSLYHEHYAMTALAAICMMLPLIRIHAPTQQRQAVLTRAGIGIIGCFWLILAIINIRITLPLWSNNASLWQWALIENPDSINAKDNLLSAYIDENDFASANRLVGQLFADHVACTNCALNAAILAVAESDPTKAAEALEKVKNSTEVLQDKQMYRTYLVTTGQMLVQQGHLEDATGIFRAAIEMDPLDPQPQLSLATTLALQNKKDEARKIGDAAITLLPSDRRHAAYKILDQAIAIGSGIPPIGRAGDK